MKIKDIKKRISTTHIIMALICIYVITTFVKQEFVMKELDKKNELVDIQLRDLNREVKSLEKMINRTDESEYIEKLAREEFDMIKPRELIYRDKNKSKTESFSD